MWTVNKHGRIESVSWSDTEARSIYSNPSHEISAQQTVIPNKRNGNGRAGPLIPRHQYGQAIPELYGTA